MNNPGIFIESLAYIIRCFLPVFLLLPLAGCQGKAEVQSFAGDEQILFLSWRNETTEILKFSGQGITELTNDSDYDSYPVWSPDGERIAYLSGGTGERRLIVMEANGSNKRILAKNIIANDVAPAWAFDSQMIAFVCQLQQRTSLCLVSTAGEWMQIMPGDWASLGSIQWAPSDPVILFHAMSGTTRDIFTYTTYSENIRNLTQRDGEDYDPTWSPDGRSIAFISNRNSQSGIYIMNIDGRNPRLLLQTNILNGLYWSPDNEQIAFSQSSGIDHLCIVNVIDQTQCCTKEDGTQPTWSPNGNYLAYESRRGKSRYIYTMDNQCNHPQPLTKSDANNFAPAWRP